MVSKVGIITGGASGTFSERSILTLQESDLRLQMIFRKRDGSLPLLI